MKYHNYIRSVTETELKNRKMVMLSTFWKQNVFLEQEMTVLRSELENKQKAINSLLETNNSLFKSIRDPSLLVIQDSTSTE